MKCANCGNTKNLIMVEYAYDHPERYDGVSEIHCESCGARTGRWSGKILKENECEPRYGVERTKSETIIEKEQFTNSNSGETVMTDFLGNQVNVGDTIVYPTRQGANMQMNRATVDNFNNNGSLRIILPSGRVTTLSNTSRLVVVTNLVTNTPSVSETETFSDPVGV